MGEKILVSACLLGVDCKYNGGNNLIDYLIEKLKGKEVIPFCSEIVGGLTTPRNPSEIDGEKVFTNSGVDVTQQFERGAFETLKLCRRLNIQKAILKSRSPSCGVGEIYDGTFSGVLTSGDGITAKMLKENGIEVISDEEFLK